MNTWLLTGIVALPYLDVASSREKLTKFVKRAGHNTISSIKGFFDTISMVDVDVYVEHSLVIPVYCDKIK